MPKVNKRRSIECSALVAQAIRLLKHERAMTHNTALLLMPHCVAELSSHFVDITVALSRGRRAKSHSPASRVCTPYVFALSFLTRQMMFVLEQQRTEKTPLIYR